MAESIPVLVEPAMLRAHVHRKPEPDTRGRDLHACGRAAAELIEVFGGGQVVDGQLVPLRSERTKESLRFLRPE